MLREKEVRRNSTIFLIDAAGTPSGYSLVSPQILIPSLLSQLGASNAVIGLIPAIAGLGANLPALLTAPTVENSRRLKRRLTVFAILERSPFLILGLCMQLLAPGNNGLMIALTLACWSMTNVITGANLPLYYAAVARTTPPGRRGMIYGFGGAVGGILGIAAAKLADYYLRTYPFPLCYAQCFIVGFVWLALAVAPFAFIAEPRNLSDVDKGVDGDVDECVDRGKHGQEQRGTRSNIVNVFSAFMEDCALRRVVLAESVLICALATTSFLGVASEQKLGFDLARIGMYNVTSMAFSAVSGIVLGLAADRLGHRMVLCISGVLAAASAILALAPVQAEIVWQMAFACSAAANMGIKVSGMNIALELSGPSRAATYSALMMAMPVPARTGAPVLVGIAADKLGFNAVFVACAAAGLLAALMFGKLHVGLGQADGGF